MDQATPDSHSAQGDVRRRAAAGLFATGAMTAFGQRRARARGNKIYRLPPGLTDADVLNFALNLEYLEAEYYLYAVTGQGLAAQLKNFQSGTITVPSNTLVPFQIPALAYWAQRIANDELAHVRFLLDGIAAEGGTPVSEPDIDLYYSFNTLAQAAGLGDSFNPFESEINFLIGAYIFEDVGVTAYAGAAPVLTNPANISYGASILAVEAEHAGAVRQYLASIGGGGITNAISALRQALSGVEDHGTAQDNNGVVNANPYNFVNADYNGQTYRRSPPEVLNIVFGKSGSGQNAGLFFPNGIQGAFNQT